MPGIPELAAEPHTRAEKPFQNAPTGVYNPKGRTGVFLDRYKVRQYASMCGINNTTLAAELGISPGAFSRYFSHYGPSKERLAKIAEVLGIEEEYFIRQTPNPGVHGNPKAQQKAAQAKKAKQKAAQAKKAKQKAAQAAKPKKKGTKAKKHVKTGSKSSKKHGSQLG
jgi:transcriptional regulator with XRE-family HTH domain